MCTTGVFASAESSSESDGISTGGIVGIAIGILVFVRRHHRQMFAYKVQAE
jgi:hypothetical protein